MLFVEVPDSSCGIMVAVDAGLFLTTNHLISRWFRLEPSFKVRLRPFIFCASTAVADAIQGEANSVDSD